jgi:hypothetical protein
MDSYVGSVSAYGFLFVIIVHFLEANYEKRSTQAVYLQGLVI